MNRSTVPSLTAILFSAITLPIAVGPLSQPALGATVNEFTLKDGGWRYVEKDIKKPDQREGKSGGLTDFIDPNGTDHFQQNWWWYRTALDSREFALTNQTDFQQPNDKTATLIYKEPAGNMADAVQFTIEYKLSASAGEADMTAEASIKNISNVELLRVHLFPYFDPDLNGTKDDDVAKVTQPNIRPGAKLKVFTTRVTDGTLGGFNARIESAVASQSFDRLKESHYEVRTSAVVKDKLADNMRTTLEDRPLAEGNVEGAYQWVFDLKPNEEVHVLLSKELPEPDSGVLAASMLCGLLYRRRRR